MRIHLTPQIDIFQDSLCVYMFAFVYVNEVRFCLHACACVKLGSI